MTVDSEQLIVLEINSLQPYLSIQVSIEPKKNLLLFFNANMKLLLNIQSGSLTGSRFELTEGFLTVGRSENCSIKFDPLQERIASKQHCFIEAKPDGFYLIDNQSTTGPCLTETKSKPRN